MGPLWIAFAVICAWLVAATLLALLIGRAARIGETKHRDEVFLRNVARESARLAHDLDQGVLQELTYIRSVSAELARVAPEAESIAVAADRALTNADAAVRALARFR